MPSITTRIRTTLATAAALSASVAGAACVAPAAARADAGTLHAEAYFGGDRQSDLLVGEPLQISQDDHEVTKVCWSPAPIDRPACSTSDLGAPARAGKQTWIVTLDTGGTRTMTRQIHPASTAALPVGADAASAKTARPVVQRATCETRGYGNYDATTGTLADPSAALRAHHDSRLAAFYTAGPGVTQAFLYRTNRAGFFRSDCLVASH